MSAQQWGQFPHSAISCPLITSAPVIRPFDGEKALLQRSRLGCKLPRAVAAASAKARIHPLPTVAASGTAEGYGYGPTVPELVQMPKHCGRDLEGKIPNKKLPAYIPTSMGLSFRMQTSPVIYNGISRSVIDHRRYSKTGNCACYTGHGTDANDSAGFDPSVTISGCIIRLKVISSKVMRKNGSFSMNSSR